jgi:hypothetical protein
LHALAFSAPTLKPRARLAEGWGMSRNMPVRGAEVDYRDGVWSVSSYTTETVTISNGSESMTLTIGGFLPLPGFTAPVVETMEELVEGDIVEVEPNDTVRQPGDIALRLVHRGGRLYEEDTKNEYRAANLWADNKIRRVKDGSP